MNRAAILCVCAFLGLGAASLSAARGADDPVLRTEAALMVSRSHPAATNEGWTGGKT